MCIVWEGFVKRVRGRMYRVQERKGTKSRRVYRVWKWVYIVREGGIECKEPGGKVYNPQADTARPPARRHVSPAPRHPLTFRLRAGPGSRRRVSC